MYAGRIVEQAPVADIFATPAIPIPWAPGEHPVGPGHPGEIEVDRDQGMVPALTDMPSGCPFHPRCPKKMDICAEKTPGLFTPASGRQVACWLYGA